jgi:hypothetical protein
VRLITKTARGGDLGQAQAKLRNRHPRVPFFCPGAVPNE